MGGCIFKVTQPGTYWVERTVDFCEIQRDRITVTLIDLPQIEMDTLICEGDVIEFGSQRISSSGIFEEVISAEDAFCDTLFILDVELIPSVQGDTTFFEITPGATVSFEGNFYDSAGLFTFSTTSSFGCDSLYVLSIDMVTSEDPNENESVIFIPNVFSPNGDGQNDELNISSATPLSLYHFKIFDRWGQEIYSSQELSDSWNGRFNNIRVPSGVYIAQVEFVLRGELERNFEIEAVSVIR